MIKIILFIIVMAAIYSKIEIMIEGFDGGWARKLPCWKIKNKFTEFILGKEISGYHVWMLIFFILIFHSPFLFIKWSIKRELLTLGTFNIYLVIEDLLWFLENFEYGILTLIKGKCDWHKRYFIGLPRSYWFGIIIGTILIILGLI